MPEIRFENDLYIHRNTIPSGLDPDLRITLDDFLLHDPGIKAKKYLNEERQHVTIDIEEACSYLRTKHHGRSAARFSVCISSHDELNELLQAPDIIRKKSLYDLCWPSNHLSNYFKYLNKVFYEYWLGHVTPPNIAYGGATEWLYIYSGSLEVELIKPTRLNLHRYAESLEDDSIKFKPEENTSTKLKLSSENFLVIPAGWISIKEAIRTTCALGGELLHGDNLACQLASFERDVMRGHSMSKYNHVRDSEIRHLYWFYASYLWTADGPKHNDATSECLRTYLTDWRSKFKKIDPSKDFHVQPTLYAPLGLDLDLVVKQLRRLTTPRRVPRRIKKLESDAEPMDQSICFEAPGDTSPTNQTMELHSEKITLSDS